jgi:type II restriction enzyme
MEKELLKKQKLFAEKLMKAAPKLTEGQIYWTEKVLDAFLSEHEFIVCSPELFSNEALNNFGDALRIHHCFSNEPFSKDKFEYILEKVMNLSGYKAKTANRGNRGHDLTINGTRFSLKTQADSNLKPDKIWISKFMELGRGKWGDDPGDLVYLRSLFLEHLNNYDRILILRALEKGIQWKYELLEIPISLLHLAKEGELLMMMDSKQSPKPGYCFVKDKKGNELFQLYFDGGGERKLQIKNLTKSLCITHAFFSFQTSPE